MKELTDNEIIKALECCTGIINIESCSQCPACVGCADCVDILREESLALINRLQADKEALIAGQETLQKALAEKIAEVERSTNLCQEQNIEIKRLIETKNRLLYNLKTVCKEKDEEAVKAEAEVERLNEWVNYLNKECCELAEKPKTSKAAAIKECLEKIEQIDISESDDYITVKKNRFDSLKKEMVGDTE